MTTPTQAQIEFNGGSWALGAICAAVYLGQASPWLLLLAPMFIISFPWLTFRISS